jgi:hypothetical protein
MFGSSEPIRWRATAFGAESDAGLAREHTSEPIRSRETAFGATSDVELARELRGLCEHSAWLAPDLARDAVFWLDLGAPPRTVEAWLLGELMRDPEGSLPVPAADLAESQPVAPTRTRRRPRFSGRRSTSTPRP